jgi:hypothetical protein
MRACGTQSLTFNDRLVLTQLNYERNRGKKGEQRTAIFLPADDFFPVRRAGPCEYLWGLCDPEQLNGEVPTTRRTPPARCVCSDQ